MSNPLDHKPFKNVFAGKGVKTKQHFKPNSNLSGYGKGSDVTVKGNKLALPVTRTGSSTGKLVKRTYTDVAPGLQGGLRETFKVLSDIKSFCESSNFGLKNEDGDIIGYVNTAEEAKRAVNDGKAYSYFDKNQMRKSIDARTKVLTGESVSKRESADIASIYRQKLLGESVNEDSSLGGRVKVTFGEYEIGTYDNLKEMQNGIAEYIANDLYNSVEGEEGEDYDYDSIRDEAIEQSLLVIDAFEETINNDRQGGNIFGTDYTVLDAEVNGSVDSYDGIWTFRFVGVEKESTSESDPMIPNDPSSDPFQALITRIRHARKTGDKAKEVQAQDELHRLATRHDKMKDPEVLDALSESRKPARIITLEDEAMNEKTATYHPSHIKVSCFTPAMRKDFQHFSINTHDGMIMHFGYPDLVHSIMKKLIAHGFTF